MRNPTHTQAKENIVLYGRSSPFELLYSYSFFGGRIIKFYDFFLNFEREKNLVFTITLNFLPLIVKFFSRFFVTGHYPAEF
jgi:hypothetical protein